MNVAAGAESDDPMRLNNAMILSLFTVTVLMAMRKFTSGPLLLTNVFLHTVEADLKWAFKTAGLL
jgi:hypothetical protein